MTERITRYVKIGVVIPIFNAFNDAVECLLRIQTWHTWTPYIQPQWKINLPLAKAWNTGITTAFQELCDYVLVINDDALVARHTINKLVEVLEDTDYMLVSAVEYLGDTATHFSCFMVAPHIFDKVGTFDENFFPLYFEDNDFTYRMKLLNVKHSGVHDALFEHKGSQSLRIRRSRGEGPQHDREFEANQAYYVAKWGGMPGQEVFKHPYNDSNMSVKEWDKKWRKEM